VAATSAALAVGGAGAREAGAKAAATPPCSRTTALEVAKDLFVWGTDVRSPVAQVLCGPFAGPGSEAMAITLSAPTCWPVQGWAVYHFAEGAWKLTLSRRGAFVVPPLVAVGSQIRETAPVYRRGDPRCIPSGGTRSRLWSWDGTRLAAGPWRQVTSGQPGTSPVRRFSSPSKNIDCWIDADPPTVGCSTRQPQRSVIMNGSAALRIRRLEFDCGCQEPSAATLAYGRQISYGGFRCVSRETGVSCVVARTGRGFEINRDGVTRVG
jgi:hypothetical protein